MNASSKIRIGFIGAGANTRLRHLPGLRAVPGVEFSAVCNRSEASGRKVAQEWGIGRVETDWRRITGAPDIDAVVIGTWPYLHADATVAALDAGKHVLTEARMASNLGEARRMRDAARAQPQRVAQIVPAPMSLGVDGTVRSMLQNGALGDLREAVITHTNALYADPGAAMSWRQDFELSGCNTLTFGIYYEILLRWLEEDPEEINARAAVFTSHRDRPDGSRAEVRIPESLTVLGRYASGARLVAHFSGVESGAPRNEFRLNGSAGSLRFDVEKGALWHTPLAGEEVAVEVPVESRRGWQVEADFIDSIRNGTPVRLTDFDSGVRYMQITEAVWRSWNEAGSPVRPAAL